MEPTRLVTDRLLLRPFGLSDVPAVHAACQDPLIPRWTVVPSPYSLRDAEEFVTEHSARGWERDETYNFAVTDRADGSLVGAMGLVHLEHLAAPVRQAELGYWTAAPYRRRGMTAEAATAVVRWAFTELGVERLEWCAEAGNEASRAVALKVGFRMEGTARAQYPRGGTRRDAWRGSLLPGDLGLTGGAPYLPYREGEPVESSPR
ncbi:GNAT family N-acetyltransferase [Streptomyces sp. NPDC059740]|uniref:GNAT family N-acetyltransferase n=1 Tax=Streptomyces sp. NPDC059740 TaxID=3346926 RepID=UPI0036464BB8